jgi:hypothetical protein
MSKIRYVLIILFTVAITFRAWQLTGCLTYASLKLTKQSVVVRTEEQINLDENKKIYKLLHNKITVGANEFGRLYTILVSPRIINELVGPAGFVLILVHILKLINSKKVSKNRFLQIIVLPTVVVLPILKPHLSIPLYGFLLSLIAIREIDFFSVSWKNILVYVGLITVTVLYFFYSWRFGTLCNEILFK